MDQQIKLIGGVEFRIWYDYSWARWNIIVVETCGEAGHLLNWRLMNGGEIFKDKIADGSIPATFLTLSRDEGAGLFAAMAEAMAKQGIRTDSDHKLLGILEAQRYHLEDLRKLLKLQGGAG